MNEYRSNAPRALFAVSAIAMGVLVTTLAVVAPVTFGAASDATLAATRTATEVAIVPSRIEVFGVREALAAEVDSESVARMSTGDDALPVRAQGG